MMNYLAGVSTRRTLLLSSLIPLLSSLLISCRSRHDLVLAGGAEGSSFKEAGVVIDRLWNDEHVAGVRLESDSAHTPKRNMEDLLAGKADLALSQNDIVIPPSKGGGAIRTILPLYPEILFIIHRDSIHAASLPELVRGRRVAFGPRGSGTSVLMRRLLERYGIDSTQYHPVYLDYRYRTLSDSVDVCCALTGFNNAMVAEMLTVKHGTLFSLDTFDLAGRGSSVDGFCMNYRGARPFIIPKNAYGTSPSRPVLTVEIDAVLLGRADLDDYLVHDLARALLDHQQSLAQDNPLFKDMTEKFDQRSLAYPLHPGVTMYLQRDEPSFLERYVAFIGVAFSIILGLGGGASALVRWNARRRKDRVDVYYVDVLAIERRIGEMTTMEECDAAISELKGLRRRAFDQLIEEKLAADESFRILTSIIDETIAAVAARRAVLMVTPEV